MYRPVIACPHLSRLKLFGGAVLDAASGPITGRAAQRHRVALLALLATTKRLHHSRDQLMTLLWPNADAERGRKLLSDSIYRINQALGGDAVTGTAEDIRLNRSRLSTDVADFDGAVDERDWRRVVELYDGPLLDGFYLPGSPEFDQWMEIERAKYAHARSVAAEDEHVRDLKQKAESATSEDEGHKALRAYNRALFEKMRKLEPSITDRIDHMETAVLKRLGGDE